MSCRHFLCCLLAGVTIAGSSAVQSHTNAPPHRQVIATASDLFRLAEDLNGRGLTDQAEQVLELLSRDPNADVRNEARYRRSKLLEARGQDRDAALLLRRILDEKPDAAPVRLELAQLLDRMGDKDAAWRELRAVQSAGLPPAVARLVDRYSEALRAARPWGASFELAIAPDSNISRATRSDTLGTVLGDFEIDEESQAKSGTGLSLRGQAFRRFAIWGESNLLVRAGAFADLYRETDFNDVALDLASGPEFQLGRNRINLEIGATQRWFGQEPFQRSVRIAGDWTRPLGRLTQLRLNASAALVDNQTNDLQDGKLYSGQLSVERALSPTTGVGLTLGLDRQSLEDPGYSTTGWRAGFLGWREIGRATLYAQAQYGRLRADERLQLFPDKRSERYLRFSLGATFRRFTFGGFAPVSRLVLERNRSTIEFYDYKRIRTEVGITRAF
jgi:hypothetical protein